MQKNFVIGAIVALGGIVVILLGNRFGVVYLVAGVIMMVNNAWSSRDVPQSHPLFEGDVEDEIRRLEKSDPAAADELVRRVFADRNRHGNEELARLRHFASVDPDAAYEFRNELLARRKMTDTACRLVAKLTPSPPGQAAVLNEYERERREIEEQLAWVEPYLKN